MGDNEAPTNSFIFDTAMNRWLEVHELVAMLNPETNSRLISTHPPTTRPPSGSLLLYDRSDTLNYKRDGYEWVKKPNSFAVREDHVKLKAGGDLRVAGWYAHRVNVPTFHRRTYYLIYPETGRDLTPPSSSTTSRLSLVLVHYLDTEQAAHRSANLASDGVSLDDSGTESASNPAVQDQEHTHRSSQPTDSHDNTLDIIGRILVEKGEGGAEAMTDNSNIDVMPEDYEFIQAMLENIGDLDSLEGAFSEEDDTRTEEGSVAVDASAVSGLERGLGATNLSLENNTDSNVLAEIVDFAPKQAFIKSKRQSDIALICSEPLPKNPPDDEIYTYYTFAAFVKLSIAQKKDADLEIGAINLSPLECATPFLYHCTIPSVAVSGERRIVVVSGYTFQKAGSDFTGVANNVAASLKQSWRNASANTQNSRPLLSSTRNPMIQILTQFSEELFDFNTGEEKLFDER